MEVLLNIDIPGAQKISSGKVREIFDVDSENLLIVTTDRISAFDVIMSEGIPDKGAVLNRISHFWFTKTAALIPNHVVATDVALYPAPFAADPRLAKRSMLVKKAKPLSVECIVRGYLSGSGWKEYRQSSSICGILLPAGLVESERLPAPIFTPTTKAELGAHDEAITFADTCAMIGRDLAHKVRDISLAIYELAVRHAASRGIIIADTKFEFGLLNDELILIDEVLTPDSSRFWPMDGYRPGVAQPSFDKQFLRDYLEGLDWNKTAPAPHLPQDIITHTRAKYIEAYERITGDTF